MLNPIPILFNGLTGATGKPVNRMLPGAIRRNLLFLKKLLNIFETTSLL